MNGAGVFKKQPSAEGLIPIIMYNLLVANPEYLEKNIE